jgi:hypothetical protein
MIAVTCNRRLLLFPRDLECLVVSNTKASDFTATRYLGSDRDRTVVRGELNLVSGGELIGGKGRPVINWLYTIRR